MKTIKFKFNSNLYSFTFMPSDKSGMGCIREIVKKNDYLLDRFNDQESTFLDIGANCGVATIILAKQNPLSRVFSFEPSPETFKLLKKNVEDNKLRNVELYNMAMTKKGIDFLNLSILPRMSGANTTYSSIDKFEEKYKSNLSVKVPCISLDQLVQQNKIDTIHLLKIDCEGAEFDIIYDSEYIKEGKVKNIVGEFHDLSYNKKQGSSDLLEYCNKYIGGLVQVSILTI